MVPKKPQAHDQMRYPLVERAVGEFRARSDRSYPSEVRTNLKNLFRDSQKGESKDEIGQHKNVVRCARHSHFMFRRDAS